ncbi:hypothetical protein [Deinococcus sp. UYEF24]
MQRPGDQSAGTAAAPTAQGQALLKAAQTLLLSDTRFQALHAPVLSRAEVNPGLQPTDAGYLYLHYDVPGAVPQELWAHWGTHDHVAWKSGQITLHTTGENSG